MALCSILRKALDKIAEIKSLLEERRIGTSLHCAAVSQTPCVPGPCSSCTFPVRSQPKLSLCVSPNSACFHPNSPNAYSDPFVFFLYYFEF